MNLIEITLSDGEKCQVRKLGIFELDAIRPPDTRPFVYTEKLGGNEITRPFDVSAWDKPPNPPTPEQMAAQPGTVPYYFYFEWQLYWAATYKAKENKEDVKRYCKDVANYILSTCISPEDKGRVVTAEDFRLVWAAALVPQLSLEDLAQSLEYTFRANFDGEAVLTKILDNAGNEDSGGGYNAIRTWEIQAINNSGFTESEWAELPLDERARRVVALKLDDWLAYLTAEKQRKNKKQGVNIG
jgi:hypothetical protein